MGQPTLTKIGFRVAECASSLLTHFIRHPLRRLFDNDALCAAFVPETGPRSALRVLGLVLAGISVVTLALLWNVLYR